uniref:Uncharacterized protein n=1 Tax=Meloidogyne enterolobii TaxID=390850 RepID=A0A6V7U219_MELEN|nr:unnamed protein product [Meloidogyne enterolobii]
MLSSDGSGLGFPFSSRVDGRGIFSGLSLSSRACTSLFRAKYLRPDSIFRSESGILATLVRLQHKNQTFFNPKPSRLFSHTI